MRRLSCLSPVIDSHSRLLIVGTMPGEQSLKKKQYYANPGNQFWRIIYGVFDLPLEFNYAKRIEFCYQQGIALWDVLRNCSREGSSDGNIKDIEVNDFSHILHEHPMLQCIAFTSQKAYQLYNRWVTIQKGKTPKYGIVLILLPSPSGQNSRMPLREKIKKWRIIKEYLAI